ncbi:MAG: hypothetical protein HFI69_06670 [Lachnospiraceae bacterium]|nr:hypothetical protein [Lachnospiraceae bacterium]
MKNKGITLEEIQTEGKAQVLAQLKEAVEAKNIRYHPTLLQTVLGQIKYLSLPALGGQITCLFLIFVLCSYLERRQAQLMMWLGTGSVLAACLGLFLMLELCRSSSFHMMELEQSCYLNVKQLWCVKMIIFGCLDLLILTALIAGVSKNVSCGMFPVMLYLLVPFVISSGLQFLVFTIFRRERREYLQMSAAVFISVVSLLPLSEPKLYTIACLGVWVLALIAGTILLTTEIVLMYRTLGSENEWHTAKL